MVVNVQEGELLPVLAAEDDEDGVQEIQELGEVVNVNKIFHTSGVGCVDSKHVDTLREKGDHGQTPDHVYIQQDLSHIVNLQKQNTSGDPSKMRIRGN
jgi:hypothetical protein